MSMTVKPMRAQRSDSTRTTQARTATIERKQARVAKRFIVGGSK